MKPVPSSVLATITLGLLANVALIAGLLVPAVETALLVTAGVLIVAALAAAGAGALARRRPVRHTHPSTRLTPLPRRAGQDRDQLVVHAG